MTMCSVRRISSRSGNHGWKSNRWWKCPKPTTPPSSSQAPDSLGADAEPRGRARHEAGRRGLIETHRAQLFSPHAAGVDAEYAIGIVITQCRPVTENDARVARAPVRDLEPGLEVLGRIFHFAFELQLQSSIGAAI